MVISLYYPFNQLIIKEYSKSMKFKSLGKFLLKHQIGLTAGLTVQAHIKKTPQTKDTSGHKKGLGCK